MTTDTMLEHKRKHARMETEQSVLHTDAMETRTGDEDMLIETKHEDPPVGFIIESAELEVRLQGPIPEQTFTSPPESASSPPVGLLMYDPVRRIDANTAAPRLFFRTFWRGITNRALSLQD